MTDTIFADEGTQPAKAFNICIGARDGDLSGTGSQKNEADRGWRGKENARRFLWKQPGIRAALRGTCEEL